MSSQTNTIKPNPAPAKPSRMVWFMRVVLWVLCIAAMALAANTWHTQRQLQAQLQQQLQHIQHTQQQNQHLSQRLSAAAAHHVENTTRINTLEQRLRETVLEHKQHTTDLTADGANEAALWLQLQTRIYSAYQRALLSGEYNALLRALHTAQQRTHNHSSPQFNRVHQAITKDLATLQNTTIPNRTQLASQINSHIQQLQQLPLLSQQLPKLDTHYKAPEHTPEEAPPSAWKKFTQKLQRGLGQLIQVRTIKTDSALLSPETGRLLREHARLRLINARLALLLGQYATAHEDITAATTLIGRYFDTQAPAAQTLQNHLSHIAQQLKQAAPPSIDHTLAALHIPSNTQPNIGN